MFTNPQPSPCHLEMFKFLFPQGRPKSSLVRGLETSVKFHGIPISTLWLRMVGLHFQFSPSVCWYKECKALNSAPEIPSDEQKKLEKSFVKGLFPWNFVIFSNIFLLCVVYLVYFVQQKSPPVKLFFYETQNHSTHQTQDLIKRRSAKRDILLSKFPSESNGTIFYFMTRHTWLRY